MVVEVVVVEEEEEEVEVEEVKEVEGEKVRWCPFEALTESAMTSRFSRAFLKFFERHVIVFQESLSPH